MALISYLEFSDMTNSLNDMKEHFGHTEQLNDEEELRLKNRQNFYLRLYMQNLSDIEIAKFIGLGRKQMALLKNSILERFSTNSWLEVIKEAFNSDILDLYDSTYPLVKPEALKFAHQILVSICQSKANSEEQWDKTLKLTSRFYASCKNLISEEMVLFLKQSSGLTRREKYVVMNLYQGHDFESIGLTIRLKENSLKHFQRKLCQKLAAKNHVYMVRNSLRFGFIPSASPEIDIHTFLDEAADRIIDCYKNNNKEVVEYLIYRLLVEFYNSIEFSNLFAGLRSTQTNPLQISSSISL